jgi:hypothetical protein
MMKQLRGRWNGLIVVFAFASLLGCQGLSSANKATNTPPPNNSQNPKPGQLAVAPTSISFSNVLVGNNQSQPGNMTNSGGASITVTQVTPTGAGFSISGVSVPFTLASGQNQAFSVIYTPKSAGTSKGNLAIANTGTSPAMNVPLSGNSETVGVLTVSPLSLNFGSVQVGSSQALPETLTNSGGADITVSQVNISGTGFSASGLNLPLTLQAGQSQPFTVTFKPTASGSSSGNIAITSSGSNQNTNVALSGIGLNAGALIPSPSSLSFGNVQVGNNQQLNETLTNSGGSNITISQAGISGTSFSMSGLNPPVLIAPGQHFTFSVDFAPTSAGNFSGNVSIASDASNPNLAVPLSGAGTPVPPGQLAVAPTTMNFGNVIVGSNAQLNGTLTATGNSVTVSSDNVIGAAFSFGGLSLPVTIPAGQHVQFTMTFTPQTSGSASGNVSFTSDASNSPTVETLTGTGVPPATHSVGLSWTASTSNNVIGYNIYRGTKNGGPYAKINSVLIASTQYTDTTVSNGVTYYYVTSAMNSNNEESAYSNQATAAVP